MIFQKPDGTWWWKIGSFTAGAYKTREEAEYTLDLYIEHNRRQQ